MSNGRRLASRAPSTPRTLRYPGLGAKLLDMVIRRSDRPSTVPLVSTVAGRASSLGVKATVCWLRRLTSVPTKESPLLLFVFTSMQVRLGRSCTKYVVEVSSVPLQSLLLMALRLLGLAY